VLLLVYISPRRAVIILRDVGENQFIVYHIFKKSIELERRNTKLFKVLQIILPIGLVISA
jgi:hypothetical protein